MQTILVRFLKTGELGLLKCGLFREDVRRILGNPLAWDGREAFAPDWRYDALRVDFYEDHRVSGYGLGFHPGQRIPDGLGDMEGRHYMEITMTEVRETLDFHAIPYEVGKNDSKLRTAAGVWIFAAQNGNLRNLLYDCPGNGWADEQWAAELLRRPKSAA